MLEIRDNFYLNGEPFKIISGAFHYFRTVPEYWQDRIEKLVNMGCNTVETYIPWNFHEPEKGNFRFDGMHDIERFIYLAEKMSGNSADCPHGCLGTGICACDAAMSRISMR